MEKAREKTNWNYLGKWVQPPLFTSYWRNFGERDGYLALGLPEISGSLLYLDGHHLMLSREVLLLEEGATKALIEEDRGFFQKIFRESDRITKNYLKFTQGMKFDGSSAGDVFREFSSKTDEMFCPWMAAFLLGPFVTRFLDLELEKENLIQMDLLSHFNLPRPTFLIQQEREVRAFKKQFEALEISHMLEEPPKRAITMLMNTHPQLARGLKFHMAEYEWVGTHHCWGDPLTPERLFFQIREAINAPRAQSREIAISGRLEYLISLVKEFAYWRQFCAECSAIGLFRARGLLKEAASHLGIGYDDIIWLTKGEISKALEKNSRQPLAKVRGRRKIYGYFPDGEGEEVIGGGKVTQLIARLVPKFDFEQKQLYGTVGSMGEAKGRVFVAFTPLEAIPMRKGDILVVPQTTPDYVMVMKKAAAIVTDEGGITCHAAIVSRELGIPCIVGTKIGTSMLKTGDRVEVDANRGIIRKLD
ncbi:MAG: PEP-utilizing enzyme [Candidatus Micrarchaeota archaeon]